MFSPSVGFALAILGVRVPSEPRDHNDSKHHIFTQAPSLVPFKNSASRPTSLALCLMPIPKSGQGNYHDSFKLIEIPHPHPPWCWDLKPEGNLYSVRKKTCLRERAKGAA